MITPAYVQTMARYNSWQNSQLTRVVNVMDQADLNLDRGAFFGSIQRTLSHLLWGDQLWLSRFDATSPPPGAHLPEGPEGEVTISEWSADRLACDGRIRTWAMGLRQIDLSGDLTWVSGASGQEFSKPLAFCIVQFFNHQTHHRGQVHAMLTAAGQEAPVSDLIYTPEDA